MLFATQNPAGAYAGRKTMSRAFKSRFLELHVADIPEKELTTILHERCAIAPSHADKLVATMSELQRTRQVCFLSLLLAFLNRWWKPSCATDLMNSNLINSSAMQIMACMILWFDVGSVYTLLTCLWLMIWWSSIFEWCQALQLWCRSEGFESDRTPVSSTVFYHLHTTLIRFSSKAGGLFKFWVHL